MKYVLQGEGKELRLHVSYQYFLTGNKETLTCNIHITINLMGTTIISIMTGSHCNSISVRKPPSLKNKNAAYFIFLLMSFQTKKKDIMKQKNFIYFC